MSGLIIMLADVLVAILLIATIASSIRLSRRIATLKGDEAAMRSTIGDLMAATDRAERAVVGLRNTIAESERSLGATLRAAEAEGEALLKAVAAGQTVMERIEAVVDVSRRAAQGQARAAPEPETRRAPSGGEALRVAMAAAQAIAERAPRRSEGRAA